GGCSASRLGSEYTCDASATKWQRPPWDSINAILEALVDDVITAMNGSPRSAAKYASETAVDPEDASITVVPSPIHPLHSAYRNSDRASRCLRLPVMWVVSSLR